MICRRDKFEIHVNGNPLGAAFPYRPGFDLKDVKRVELHGGSGGMEWTDLQFYNKGKNQMQNYEI